MQVALRILDIASYVIAGGAFIGVCVIIVRKMKFVASIDTENVPKHQQEKVKKELETDRLLRKFSKAAGWSGKYVKPVFAKVHDATAQQFQRLMQVERKIALKIAKKQRNGSGVQTEKRLVQLEEQAQAAIEQKDFKSAEQKFIEMISMDPGSLELYKRLGDLYMDMQEYAQAKEAYQFIIDKEEKKIGKKITRDDDVASASAMATRYFDLSQAMMALERWADALPVLEEALRLEPNNPKYLDQLITVTIKLGNADAARSALQRLEEANPENNKIADFKVLIDEMVK